MKIKMIKRYENETYLYDGSAFFRLLPLKKPTVHKIAIIINGVIELPPTNGFIYRLYHESLHLIQSGKEVVWILSNSHGQNFNGLENECIRMHFLPQNLFFDLEYVKSILKIENPDVVQFEVTQDCLYFGPSIKRDLNLPIVLEVHECDYLLRASMGRKDLDLIDFMQRAAIDLADAVIFMTSAEKDYFAGDKFFLAPNGVCRSFPILRQETPEPVILFIGNLFYFPNQQAIRFLIDHVLPAIKNRVPNVRLKIIGMGPQYRNDLPEVQFTGELKEDEQYRKALSEGYLGVCPVLSGAGMKVKILNYAAGGFPVVTTPLGAMGYEKLQGLMICEPNQIANQILELFSSNEIAAQNGALLHKTVFDFYSWDSIINTVINAYEFAWHCVYGEKEPIKNLPCSLFFEEKRDKKQAFPYHVLINGTIKIINKT